MKFNKFIVSSLLGFGLALTANAATFSYTITPGTATSFKAPNGAFILKSAVITATTATNGIITLIDAPTNVLTYVVGAYSNVSSYATNLVTLQTNYYGYVSTVTNFVLVDVSNSVAQTTNSYPTKLTASAVANTSATLNNLNTYFQRGVLLTNASSGTVNIVGTYQQ